MAKSSEAEPVTGRQAPKEVWSPDALQEALSSGTVEQKLETMRRAGVIDAQNLLVKVKREKGWITRAANYQPK